MAEYRREQDYFLTRKNRKDDDIMRMYRSLRIINPLVEREPISPFFAPRPKPKIESVTVRYADGRTATYDPAEVTGDETSGISLAPRTLDIEEILKSLKVDPPGQKYSSKFFKDRRENRRFND